MALLVVAEVELLLADVDLQWVGTVVVVVSDDLRRLEDPSSCSVE